MRSDESRVSTSRASSPDGRGVSLPISEPFPINPQTSASPNAGQPLAMQKHVRQTIITQQHCVQLAFFRNAGLPAELCRLAADAFRGLIVPKNLVRQFRGQFPVPTYVVEFMLGRYCATTDEKEIAEGLEVVRAQLS